MPRHTAICAAVLTVALAACSGASDGATKAPSASITPEPAAESSTTTTQALTPEQEVEAAYLKSWDVYTRAVRNFSTAGLEDVYAKAALTTVRDEIAQLQAKNTPVRCAIDHNLSVTVGSERFAAVTDHYVNHCVLTDGATGRALEADPNEQVAEVYLFEHIEDAWKVIGIRDAE